MSKKVALRTEECIACGLCYGSVPTVFSSDEGGQAYVSDPNGADEATIQSAIDDCPVSCIYWEET
ncbi:ferredoxin [Chrysiogenes arsenatis]|uniref:ferredoxin n=1 Tax=Chrysiogenes arsenatis TaxID=309797 RepID=UPI000408B9DF|nr:ferredoxin [Chrysiogenes arsenatis]